VERDRIPCLPKNALILVHMIRMPLTRVRHQIVPPVTRGMRFGDETHFPREVVEAALVHAVGDGVGPVGDRSRPLPGTVDYGYRVILSRDALRTADADLPGRGQRGLGSEFTNFLCVNHTFHLEPLCGWRQYIASERNI